MVKTQATWLNSGSAPSIVLVVRISSVRACVFVFCFDFMEGSSEEEAFDVPQLRVILRERLMMIDACR